MVESWENVEIFGTPRGIGNGWLGAIFALHLQHATFTNTERTSVDYFSPGT